MHRLAAIFAVLLLGSGAGLWALSAPRPDPVEAVPGDAGAGRLVFAAAGCASCHLAPDMRLEAGVAPVLAGGHRFETAFGTFVAPNISSDPKTGIGAWSDEELARAITQGISPDGRHYYPAFPYRAYALAEPGDIADLVAYLRTLPADATPSAPHELAFPFDIRRGLGLWKLAAGAPAFATDAEGLSEAALRGRYLAEALGHCGECHTPRDAIALAWTEADIAAYLDSGLTPDFDVAGGSMAAVVRGLSQLAPEDRAALAAYLKAVPGD